MSGVFAALSTASSICDEFLQHNFDMKEDDHRFDDLCSEEDCDYEVPLGNSFVAKRPLLERVSGPGAMGRREKLLDIMLALNEMLENNDSKDVFPLDDKDLEPSAWDEIDCLKKSLRGF